MDVKQSGGQIFDKREIQDMDSDLFIVTYAIHSDLRYLFAVDVSISALRKKLLLHDAKFKLYPCLADVLVENSFSCDKGKIATE